MTMILRKTKRCYAILKKESPGSGTITKSLAQYSIEQGGEIEHVDIHNVLESSLTGLNKGNKYNMYLESEQGPG